MTGEFAGLAGTHSKMPNSFRSTRKSEPPNRSDQKPSRAMGRPLDGKLLKKLMDFSI
jgi:hypothetical protein